MNSSRKKSHRMKGTVAVSVVIYEVFWNKVFPRSTRTLMLGPSLNSDTPKPTCIKTISKAQVNISNTAHTQNQHAQNMEEPTARSHLSPHSRRLAKARHFLKTLWFAIAIHFNTPWPQCCAPIMLSKKVNKGKNTHVTPVQACFLKGIWGFFLLHRWKTLWKWLCAAGPLTSFFVFVLEICESCVSQGMYWVDTWTQPYNVS